MAKQIPFAKKYPLSKTEWETHAIDYMYSRERQDGKSFRSFLVRKLGKR